MQKPISSFLLRGIVEEVDISKISLPSFVLRNLALVNLDELTLSIQRHGLLCPIIVKTKDTDFEIISGVLRYMACKRLGWRKITCHIVELDEKEAFEISLVENIQRRNLDPMEEAKAFKMYVVDSGWGAISDLSKRISKSVSYIYKRMSILELPQKIINDFNESIISVSAAEELVFVKDADKQLQIEKQLIDKKMTIKQIRKLVKESNDSVYDYGYECDVGVNNFSETKNSIIDMDIRTQRSFDKTITTLKIALNKVGAIIEDVEDNWRAYEMLMQHKNMLNKQIDILIKEKKKLQ
jgi:ParB family chromosome partitioning protein